MFKLLLHLGTCPNTHTYTHFWSCVTPRWIFVKVTECQHFFFFILSLNLFGRTLKKKKYYKNIDFFLERKFTNQLQALQSASDMQSTHITPAPPIGVFYFTPDNNKKKKNQRLFLQLLFFLFPASHLSVDDVFSNLRGWRGRGGGVKVTEPAEGGAIGLLR